jgi:hypothetical protein
MGKNRDLIQILILVLIGMFIPFLGSVTISYGFNVFKIGTTFGYFLLIFAIELLIIYLYFAINNWKAKKNIEKLKPK